MILHAIVVNRRKVMKYALTIYGNPFTLDEDPEVLTVAPAIANVICAASGIRMRAMSLSG